MARGGAERRGGEERKKRGKRSDERGTGTQVFGTCRVGFEAPVAPDEAQAEAARRHKEASQEWRLRLGALQFTGGRVRCAGRANRRGCSPCARAARSAAAPAPTAHSPAPPAPRTTHSKEPSRLQRNIWSPCTN